MCVGSKKSANINKTNVSNKKIPQKIKQHFIIDLNAFESKRHIIRNIVKKIINTVSSPLGKKFENNKEYIAYDTKKNKLLIFFVTMYLCLLDKTKKALNTIKASKRFKNIFVKVPSIFPPKKRNAIYLMY